MFLPLSVAALLVGVLNTPIDAVSADTTPPAWKEIGCEYIDASYLARP